MAMLVRLPSFRTGVKEVLAMFVPTRGSWHDGPPTRQEPHMRRAATRALPRL
jgi:hypothetical protein